jgi:hypothetical protein
MTEDSILKQIEQEYLIGYNSIEQVREQKRQDKEIFFSPNRDENKINVRTVFQAFRMKMAIRYSNRPKAEWTRRRA